MILGEHLYVMLLGTQDFLSAFLMPEGGEGFESTKKPVPSSR